LRVYLDWIKTSIEKMLFKEMSVKKTRIITVINIIILLVDLFDYRKFNFISGVLCFTLIVNIHSCIFTNEKNRLKS